MEYVDNMRCDDIIAKLKAAEPALRARGIRRAAVFGSIARGDNRPDSDIDILVEFEPGSEGSIYEYMNLKEYIAGLFDGPVDVIDRDALKPHLRAPAHVTPSMPSDNEKERGALGDMLRHIDLAERFAHGLDEEALSNNLQALYAVIRSLEIISEASRRLSDELKARHPDIPWRDMAAAEISTGTIMRT